MWPPLSLTFWYQGYPRATPNAEVSFVFSCTCCSFVFGLQPRLVYQFVAVALGAFGSFPWASPNIFLLAWCSLSVQASPCIGTIRSREKNETHLIMIRPIWLYPFWQKHHAHACGCHSFFIRKRHTTLGAFFWLCELDPASKRTMS